MATVVNTARRRGPLSRGRDRPPRGASWTTDVAKVGGWFALLDSFAAGYLGAAIVVNVSVNKPLLPLLPTNLWQKD